MAPLPFVCDWKGEKGREGKGEDFCLRKKMAL
jgi:hypothetical protein